MRAMVIEDKRAPCGVQCLHCRKVARVGDVILVHTVHNHGYLLFHKDCIRYILEEAPLDSFENIKQKVEEGSPLFD